MDVKFTNTTSSKLNNVAITNGQLIALSDKQGLYYDLGGVRRNVTPLSISDVYATSGGTAANRVAASSYALNSAYNSMSSKVAAASVYIKIANLGIPSLASKTSKIGTISRSAAGISNTDNVVFVTMSQLYQPALNQTVLAQDLDIAFNFIAGTGSGTNNLVEYKIFNNHSAACTANVIVRILYTKDNVARAEGSVAVV